MKTEEDEAFDDLAKKQNAWGGGFKAKQAMAADKFIAAEERKAGERYGYVPKLHPSEWMDAQPAQEPPSEWAGIKAILDEYGLQAIDFVADFKAALAQSAQEPVADRLERLLWEYIDLQAAHPEHRPDLKTWPHLMIYAPQPAQEPEMLTIAYQSGYYDGKQAALAGREWNFCERCGKRTADIHTCTPPQGDA